MFERLNVHGFKEDRAESCKVKLLNTLAILLTTKVEEQLSIQTIKSNP